MTRERTIGLARLNLLLELAGTDLLSLDDEGWQQLYDKIALAVFGVPRQRGRSDDFNFAAATSDARQQVGLAKIKMQQFLGCLSNRWGKGQQVEFPLREERLFLGHATGRFTTMYRFKELETMIYRGFLDGLERNGVTPHDFYVCNDPRCGIIFIPRKKPARGSRTFCCTQHENRVNQQAVRQRGAGRRQSPKRGPALAKIRQAGRERSHRHYVRKVTVGRPNVKVARRERRPG